MGEDLCKSHLDGIMCNAGHPTSLLCDALPHIIALWETTGSTQFVEISTEPSRCQGVLHAAAAAAAAERVSAQMELCWSCS